MVLAEEREWRDRGEGEAGITEYGGWKKKEKEKETEIDDGVRLLYFIRVVNLFCGSEDG